jgi:hypothetical protein
MASVDQDQPLVDALEKADLVTEEGNRELASEGLAGHRTAGVAAAALMMWITWMFVLPFLYWGTTAADGGAATFEPVYTTYIALAAIGGVVSSIAMWFLRSWAIWLFAAVSAVHQVALAIAGDWSIVALLVPLAVFAFAFAQRDKLV